MVAHPATSPAPSPTAAPAAPPSAISPPSPPLPALSPHDRALLLRLFALNENFTALAAELASSADAGAEAPRSPGSPPSDLLSLYAWSTRPDIATWIAFHHNATDQALRALALDTLATIVKSSDNKPEQRRAATTILRALDHKWPTQRRATSPIQNPKSKIQNPHTPSITPSPTNPPIALAAAIARDLSEDFYEQAVCTINACHAPGAPIIDPDFLDKRLEPIPVLSDQPQFSDPVPCKHDPMFAEGVNLTVTDPLTRGRFTLSFVRTYLGPWRLFDINSG